MFLTLHRVRAFVTDSNVCYISENRFSNVKKIYKIHHFSISKSSSLTKQIFGISDMISEFESV